MGEEAPFYWVNLKRGWWSFVFMSKTIFALKGVSFYG